ncbi:hypothetical protein F5141DRAFT_1208407 [Pisolithus sp. B1]|nr:hypothetical protein F5141DRAFT_1208407 [Pisolithus sp. B1]
MPGFLDGACTDVSMMSTSQMGPPAENVQTIQDDSLFGDNQMASYASANEEPQVETPRVQHTQLPDSAGQHGHLISPSSSITCRRLQDKPAVPTTSEKCCYREVDFSESLHEELIKKQQMLHRLHQKMCEHGQHNDIQQAVAAAQQEFAKQSANMQAVIWLQEAKMKALCSALQEYTSHQEQVQQEHEVVDQKHREDLDGLCSQFENTVHAEMGELLRLSNTNLENVLQQHEHEMEECLREEVEMSSKTMMVNKERELANLEQWYSHHGVQSTIHPTTVWDLATEIGTPDQPSPPPGICQNEVRCLFKEVFGITQDTNFIVHQLVPVDDMQAYEHEDGPGPDSDKLAFDLSKNHTSPWNAEVIKVLLCKLRKHCEDKNWPIKQLDSYIQEILRYHYKKLCTMWLRGQPKLTCNGNSKTPAKVEARMLAHLEKLGKESCQATCCHNKYKQRMAVLDYVIQLRMEVSDDDLTAWKWLQHLVKTLGEQGMSSKESAVENEIERVLHVKRMEW